MILYSETQKNIEIGRQDLNYQWLENQLIQVKWFSVHYTIVVFHVI